MTGEDYEARKDEHRPDWPGYKSDHLPECEWNDETRVNRHCICDRLRACEQRVREDERVRLLTLADKVRGAQYATGLKDGYNEGFEAGLAAARDAVRNTPTDPRWNILQIQRAFLAAIDALKEKP